MKNQNLIYLFPLFIVLTLSSKCGAQEEMYKIGTQWILTNSKNPCDIKTQKEIQKGLSKIASDNAEMVINQCMAVLKKVLKQNFDCEHEYYLLNNIDFTSKLIPCTGIIQKPESSQKTLTESMRSSEELWTIRDLEKYFSEPIIVFDTLTIDLSRIVKKTDQLQLIVNDSIINLKSVQLQYSICSSYFRTINSLNEFRIVNKNNIQFAVNGRVSFFSKEEKESVLYFAQSINKITSFDKVQKFNFINNYALSIYGNRSLDKRNLIHWLVKNNINII
jgi:hypothetical protein